LAKYEALILQHNEEIGELRAKLKEVKQRWKNSEAKALELEKQVVDLTGKVETVSLELRRQQESNLRSKQQFLMGSVAFTLTDRVIEYIFEGRPDDRARRQLKLFIHSPDDIVEDDLKTDEERRRWAEVKTEWHGSLQAAHKKLRDDRSEPAHARFLPTLEDNGEKAIPDPADLEKIARKLYNAKESRPLLTNIVTLISLLDKYAVG